MICYLVLLKIFFKVKYCSIIRYYKKEKVVIKMNNLWIFDLKKKQNKLVEAIPKPIYFILCGILAIFLFFSMQAITSMLFSIIIPLDPEKNPAYRDISRIFSFCGVWILLLIYRYGFKNSYASIGFTKTSTREFVKNIISAVIIGMIINYVSIFLYSLILKVPMGMTDSLTQISSYPFILLCVVSYLIQGGAEELIYRGILFKWLAKKYNLLMIGIISSLVFGIMHLPAGIMIVIYATFFGILLFLIAVDSNSIYKCMIVHGIYNVSEEFFKFNDEAMSKAKLFYINTDMSSYQAKAYIITIVIVILLSVYYVIKLNKKDSKWYLTRK
jgi:uncharacterized protein